jgi:arylsulfatase A-like enzyme
MLSSVRVGGVLLLAAAVSAGSHQIRPATHGSNPRPNVVLIMMDDLGYGDLGSYGAPDARTPNVDGLARKGVRFTDAYANAPVCSATRAALMTGRYQQRVGLEWALGPAGKDVEYRLPVTGASFPALLKKAGYATALIGKWHLGLKPENGPNAHGFDQFFGFLGGAVGYYSHIGMDGRPDLYENTTPVTSSRYLTDEITARAVSFVTEHAPQPFFLEVAYNATHWPFEPPDRTDGSLLGGSNIYQLPGDPNAPTRGDYVRMLERADRGVGEILTALDKAGLTGNTLVIFTNDNGGEWLSRNAPFFDRKSTVWEGGIRVPLIMTWPQRLPAGRKTPQLAMTMDVTASILEAAGVTPDSMYPPDGIDLLPIAAGTSPVVARDLFWRINQPTRVQRAVRSEMWKLIVDGLTVQDGIHVMLFDLRNDPGERDDLAWRYPARVAELRRKYALWELGLLAQ